MVNAPPPNLMQGIQLIENGRRAEALPYLRYAVQNEAVTAEGWLWLAAATDDLEEYRYCVDQALRLDPFHPRAQRMRNELERPELHVLPQGNGYAAGGVGFETERQKLSARYRPSRRWRLLRGLVLVLIVGGCVGGAAALIISGVIQEAVRGWLEGEKTHALEFVVGGPPAYRFRVEVPDTWVPADTDEQSWRDKRDELMAAFPAPDGQTSVWEQVGTSFSRAARDPVYGEISPPVRLVETDVTRLEQGGMVAALTLLEIVPYPQPGEAAADACARMRLLEQYFKTTGALAMQPDSAIVDTALTERPDQGDCIYAVHRRYTNQTQVAFSLSADRVPSATREITLAVPVGIERYALWQITLADSVYDDYEPTVERIFDTLVYQAP
jgi:hypothetical protein